MVDRRGFVKGSVCMIKDCERSHRKGCATLLIAWLVGGLTERDGGCGEERSMAVGI